MVRVGSVVAEIDRDRASDVVRVLPSGAAPESDLQAGEQRLVPQRILPSAAFPGEDELEALGLVLVTRGSGARVERMRARCGRRAILTCLRQRQREQEWSEHGQNTLAGRTRWCREGGVKKG